MKSVLLLIAVVCSVTGITNAKFSFIRILNLNLLCIKCYCYKGLPALYNDERIIDGELAKSGQYPYVVSITENDRHFCGGFIYSNRWIVTAASCVVG
jgi:hypothetical protein